MADQIRAHLRRRHPPNLPLFGGISATLFLLAWLLPVTVKNTRTTLAASTWGAFITGAWSCSAGETATVLAVVTAVVATTSVVSGWVLHCLLILLVAAIRREGRARRP
jgi:hypothetical protein